MSSNSTNTGGNGLSAENVVSIVGMGVSLCLSFITFLTVILTCTYVVIKSKFRDKQDTNINISTKTTKDGGTESILQIGLKNNESYTLNAKKFDNKKEKDKKVSEKKDESNDDDLNGVLNNNHKGDHIIADTRITAIDGAYRTFLKTQQIQALKQDGLNKAPLDVSILKLKPKEGEKQEEILVNIESNDFQPELLGNLTIDDQVEN